MDCEELDRGVYLFHALGLTEGEERQQIDDHLSEDCPKCMAGVDEAASIWYVYGIEGGLDAEFTQIHPSRGLRRRILNGARRKNLWNTLVPTFSTWRYGTGFALLAVTTGLGWKLGEQSSTGENRRIAEALQNRENTIAQLTGQLDALRNAVATAQPAGQGTPTTVPGPTRIVTVTAPDPRVPELERLIAELQAEDGTLQQDLSAQQTRANQLAQTLATANQDLARARQDLERAEAARRESETERAAERTQRDAQLAAARQRVRQLEQQVLDYQQVLDEEKGDATQYRLIAAALQSPTATLVRLQGTEQARSAYGTALVAEGSRVVFFASQLPALPAGRTYQLWLMRRNGPAVVSAGVFRQSAQGAPTIEFTNAQLIRGVTGFAVSEEPAGGSPLPTGRKFLIGTVRG